MPTERFNLDSELDWDIVTPERTALSWPSNAAISSRRMRWVKADLFRHKPSLLSRQKTLLDLLSPKPQQHHVDQQQEAAEEELFAKELNALFHVPSLKEKTSRLSNNMLDILFKKKHAPDVMQRAQNLVRKRDYLHLVSSYPIQPEPEGEVKFEYFRRIFSHLNRQIRDINGMRGNLKMLTGPWINEEVLELLETSLAKYDFHLAAYLPRLTSSSSADELRLALQGEVGLTCPPSENTSEVPEEMWMMAVHSVMRQISKCIEDGNGYRKIGIAGTRSDKVATALDDLSICKVFHFDAEPSHWSKKETRESLIDHISDYPDKFLVPVDCADLQLSLFDFKLPDNGILLLITRSKKVYEMMDVDIEIRVEDHLLPWELFCSHVGSLVYSPPFIEKAILLVKGCNDHLLAIVLLATTLRNVPDISLWDLAIQELASKPSEQVQETKPSELLQETKPSEQVQETNEVMVRVVKLIWDNKDNLTKHCIVQWASLSFPETEGTLLSELVQKGLVDNGEEGKHILEDVLNSLLLEKVNSHQIVMRLETKMVLKKHFEARLPSIYLREGGSGLKETPKDEFWDAKEIYLEKNNLSKLPQKPNSFALKKLFLHDNKLLMKIPDSFFENMPLLQLLDLSHTRIKCLPPSISKLVMLQTFCLRGCQLLMELPPQIGALVSLEVFDLEGTELMYLPKEIGELACLRCFKVSFCLHSSHYRKANQQIQRSIPEKVFSRLVQLYELSIDLSPDGEWSEDDVQAILTELSSLKKLKIIQLDLPSGQLLQQLRWDGRELIYSDMSRFRLTVGCHRQRIISRLPGVVEQKFKIWESSENCLKYINGESVSGGVTMALKHTHVLFLDRHWTVKHLSEFGTENMENLKYCLLVECNKLETIIDRDHNSATGVAHELALGSLRYLGVYYMENLQTIWRGPIHKDTLSKLAFLHLHSCPKLVTVFPPALCANLQLLERLIVEDCPIVNSLISQRAPNLTSSSPGYFLLKLKHISLLHLPELDSISNGLRAFPELNRLVVYDCPKLQKILSVDTSCNDVTIIGEKKWWDALQWQDSEFDFPRPTFNELKGGQDLMNHAAKLMYPESVMI